MFNLASWKNLKAIVISFLGLLLTFVDDHDVRWKYGRVSRMSQLLPLTYVTDNGLNLSLICRRAWEY